MAKSKIHVGLEIGTSKTCMVVGELHPSGAMTILGLGEVKSAGVRKGEIFDIHQAIDSVIGAWNLAQEHADVDIISVFVAVTGAHIEGANNRGTYRLPKGENVVDSLHIDEVVSLAKDVPIDSDRTVIHRSPGMFILDGNENMSYPEGLSGSTLECDYHIVHGNKMRINNTLRCVREVPLEVEEMVFSPVATGLATLSESARKRGCLLIDIGGGTTDFCLYHENCPVVSGCIAVGGDHLTNDIHTICNIPIDDAELIKVTEGDASTPPSRAVGVAKLPSQRGREEVVIPRSELNKIIQARLQETMEIVKQKLPEHLRENLQGGIYLTGGTSLLRGINVLVEDVFHSPAYKLNTPDITNVTSYLDDPRYYTAIGLIRYAQRADAELMEQPKKSFLKRIFGVFR